jgi:cytochrome c
MRELRVVPCIGLALAVVLWGTAAHADLGALPASPIAPTVGLGVPLESAQIARFDITIFPDGRNLPKGQGSVAHGGKLFQAHCAACHGEKGIEGPAARLAGSDGFFGWNDPLRILRIKEYPLLVQSVGARWPYATTLFDYVRRAMPYHAPKSLSDDEVYAITGQVLYLNGLVEADAVMTPESMRRVVMPARARTVVAWQPQKP